MIRKNGFHSHFATLDPLPDKHNTVIPYKVFNVRNIKEYEAYLTIKLFNRDDLPVMSSPYRHMIQDYLQTLVIIRQALKFLPVGSFFLKANFYILP